MGGGGAAPPIKLHDVALLIGGCMVVAAFILMFWDPFTVVEPPVLEEDLPPGTSSTIDTWKTFDLSDGDEVMLDVDLVECPGDDDAGDCGLVSMAWTREGESPGPEDWTHHNLEEGEGLEHTFDVPDDGEWTLHLRTDSEISMDMDVQHQWMAPWIALFAGLALAGWGFWMAQQRSE